MLDFVSIEQIPAKSSTIVTVDFKTKRSKDLMIRGKAFYAIWDEERQMWSQNELDVQRLVDKEIHDYVEIHAAELGPKVQKKLLKDFSSNKWTEWQKYCKSLPDNYHDLDEVIHFENETLKKTDYATKKLPYPLCDQDIPAYDRLMSVLYAPEERKKIEWAIGAIISGDSKWIQKFMVLYGGPGTGKSTVLNIIQELFTGYWSLLEAQAITSNSQFGLESLKDNALIAIQHDGDLSRIEDNSKLNSVVSHEKMVINEKYKSKYSFQFHSFLWIGTNKPVKITDSKSGVMRRLIDVQPTGNKIPRKEFNELMEQIKFEYSGIASHCLHLYESLGPNYYDSYIPEDMMMKTNDFYNFIDDNYDLFENIPEDDGIGLNVLWRRYKEWCEDSNIPYPLSKRIFKDEMKNYFADYKDRTKNCRSVYYGFLENKFRKMAVEEKIREGNEEDCWLKFDRTRSDFDEAYADCKAQYATKDGIPKISWDECETCLGDLDTTKLHYVQGLPKDMFVVDFDLKNEKGGKDFERNLEAAKKWPPTYAELSKSGQGIHLHYFTDFDTDCLSRLVEEDIEIKVFSGKSSLRRCLSKCNDLPVATINSGLPLKEKKPMLKEETIKSEKKLREMIERNLRKEIHPATKPSIDFIYKILDDAYQSGLHYDVEDMRPAIQYFAMNSTHQGDYCLRLLSRMKFKSEEPSENEDKTKDEAPIVFFDVEVFPNLFIMVCKQQGPGKTPVALINPKPEEVEAFTKFRLVGFNNRNYDNHILYARMMGYNEEQLYRLSQRIIAENDKSAKFGEAYNLSYTDIYDFLSASNKMSLKKWEIKLGIHHQELGLPWDQPVPKELWKKAADYCINDVVATEAVWDANQEDWFARVILAKWAGMTVNDTTNSLTTRLIVGKDPHPQSQFIYTDLSTIFPGYEYNPFGIDKSRYNEGTKIVQGKSIYKGKDPGEGGYAIGYPGIYYQVALLDVASMHPSSAIRLKIFGEEYTLRFEDIVNVRLYIKHKDYESAKRILPEELHGYLSSTTGAKKLSKALKTPINAVYGLTSASFDNKLRDPRNKDNIVAKYGALFMINLEEEVTKRGFKVVHIKTDSIKIANATPEIIQFVMDYGKEYGYTFEHEATYSKICLVNDAVYIAKYEDPDRCAELYGYVPGDNEEYKNEWTATGTQFQIPYVFKTLFSKEPIEFSDLCETKSVSTAMYLDFNEKLNDLPFDEEGNATPDDHPSRHDRRFVGKVGSFCPMKEGCGAAVLERQNANDPEKFSAVTGTKKPGKDGVYRWMESEMVRTLGLEDQIDRSYYNKLVDDAVDEINKYGDFEQFVSDGLPEWMTIPDDCPEEIPFDEFPMNAPEAA